MKPAREERDEPQLSWSEMPPSMRAMVVLVLLEVIFLAVALYLGIGGDGSGGVGEMTRYLLGRGEVRSEAWLRVAWLMPVVIAITLFAAWRMGTRVLANHEDGERVSPWQQRMPVAIRQRFARDRHVRLRPRSRKRSCTPWCAGRPR